MEVYGKYYKNIEHVGNWCIQILEHAKSIETDFQSHSIGNGDTYKSVSKMRAVL